MEGPSASVMPHIMEFVHHYVEIAKRSPAHKEKLDVVFPNFVEEALRHVRSLSGYVEPALIEDLASLSIKERVRSLVSSIPNELLCHIFTFSCSSPSDAVNVGQVCKAWNTVALPASSRVIPSVVAAASSSAVAPGPSHGADSSLASANHLWKGIAASYLPFFCFERSLAYPEEMEANLSYPCSSRSFFGPTSHAASFPRKVTNWKQAVQEVFTAKRVCVAQVFCKHMRVSGGNMVSAYDASIKYDTARRSWTAYYFCQNNADGSRSMFAPETEVTADRIRAVPEEMITFDPYVIWDLGIEHRDVSLLAEGTEVEIQYRFRAGDPFGWWRGFVKSVECDSTDTSGGLSNEDFTSSDVSSLPIARGYKVAVQFPQYEESVSWNICVVSLDCATVPVEDPNRSHPGGLRIVRSKQESAQWQTRFEFWRNPNRQNLD